VSCWQRLFLRQTGLRGCTAAPRTTRTPGSRAPLTQRSQMQRRKCSPMRQQRVCAVSGRVLLRTSDPQQYGCKRQLTVDHQGFFNVQFYTKTAVVNRFVQFQIKVCAVLHIIIGQICGFLWACESRKALQLQGGFAPDPPQGALPPGNPLGALPPDPRYSVALRARHGNHTMCSCKLTLKKAMLITHHSLRRLTDRGGSSRSPQRAVQQTDTDSGVARIWCEGWHETKRK